MAAQDSPPDKASDPETQTQPVEPDEEQAEQARAALASELASAKRFEAELDALLLADGQLDTTKDEALIKLSSLATRCGILSNSAMHDEVRLVLLGYQARALAAISSLTAGEQDPGRADQLNDVAQQIAAIDLPGASAASDYWLLIADLTQQASSKQSPTRRQARTEQSLKTFIRKHADDSHATEYLLDTRLSLAQLMDQRGAQRDTSKQLDLIGELPEDSPRLAEVNRLRDNIARLKTPIVFESISTELVNWRSSDHVGKPVLIHVYADGVDPSVRMIDVISRSIVEGAIGGIAIVSLRVGEPVAGSSAPPWPTLPVQLEPGGVLDQLGVAVLPTLAWLDSEGRLASIGTTAAVLDQLAALQPDEPEDPESDEQPPVDAESDPDPAADEPAESEGAGVENPSF